MYAFDNFLRIRYVLSKISFTAEENLGRLEWYDLFPEQAGLELGLRFPRAGGELGTLRTNPEALKREGDTQSCSCTLKTGSISSLKYYRKFRSS